MATQTMPIPDPNRALADKSVGTTAENPWPLRLLTKNMRDYIARMPELWVEAQVVEYTPRPGTRTTFFQVRDLQADVSITVTAFAQTMDTVRDGFEAGSRVVMRVKPDFWETRGSLSLRAHQIFIQGEGDLLARIERLRKALAAEGLFDVSRKRPLPFLPRRIGLICGRNAKAKEDVLANARLRWPSAQFTIREVAVQGVNCVPEVSAALSELAAIDDIDVIVITRGGGSVEDLLPFSDEGLVRLAATITTPLVSAIGHEEDAPLLDLVADYRASTPTDAARRIVPDAGELTMELEHMQRQARAAVQARLARESETLTLLASRPVLSQPSAAFENQLARLSNAEALMRTTIMKRLHSSDSQIASMEATLRAISPAATLARGYSILRTPAGEVVTSAESVSKGDLVEAILSSGTLVAQVFGTNPHGSINPEPKGNES